ncbi:thermonuclease family protein [uncultured Paracoccus sp.]|uniref:thermonuclease family protein n=1 Tax=uncultured Paracoccus sp. TaxID=189685 RepID=UPI0025E94C3E|nr:thermonuclease family protein [uncultured Paracoccus sp.]
MPIFDFQNSAYHVNTLYFNVVTFLLRLLLRLLIGRQPRHRRSRTSDFLIGPPGNPAPVRKQAPARVAAPVALRNAVHTGRCYVIDGDTIQIGDLRLRLAGIDAPELEHPWGKVAKGVLIRLCKGQIVRAEISPELSYDRLVATCYLPDGRDLSAEMVRLGAALDWPKFSGGRYAHLEPIGIRKKHWKAAARQRGDMRVFHK